MSIYEVFYLEEEVIDDGYTVQQHIPVKYFQNQIIAKNYCTNHTDRNYLWQKLVKFVWKKLLHL